MFTATIRTVGGQEIKLASISAEQKKSLESSIGTEAKFSHNNGASTTIINLATVESIVISGKPLKAY